MKQMLEYVHGNSVFHRLNPLIKLLWAFVTCMACFISSSHLFLLGILLLTVVIAAASGVLERAVGVYKALFFLGMFLMLFQLLSTPRERVIFYILPGVPVTDQGLSFSSLFMLRMMAALSSLSLMLTPMNELLTAMTDSLKFPYRYAFAVVTALRFIPTFSREMDQIMQAQRSRGYETDIRNPFQKGEDHSTPVHSSSDLVGQKSGNHGLIARNEGFLHGSAFLQKEAWIYNIRLIGYNHSHDCFDIKHHDWLTVRLEPAWETSRWQPRR